MEAQGDPLKGSPYPPNLPDPPRTSLHGNRRIGVKKISRVLGAAVAVQGSFWAVWEVGDWCVRLRA